MNLSRLLFVGVFSTLICACSGGGGGSSTAPGPAWQKFRADGDNSGLGVAAVGSNRGNVQSVQIDPTPGATPISSSPAIAEDGTVYVGSEGGTLAALTRTLGVRWQTTECGACPEGDRNLGPLVSSPAVYTVNGQTNILIGSSDGKVFAFTDTGGSQPSCTGCFRPNFRTPCPGLTAPPSTPSAKFLSSPSFTTDPVLATVSGIFIGARIEVPQADPMPNVTPTPPIGKFYALNSDGSLKWEYPGCGDNDIGEVTSSPALGLGGLWYFTAKDPTDGNLYLYALTGNGSRKAKMPLASAVAGLDWLVTSPLIAANSVFAAAATDKTGKVFRYTQDGVFVWSVPLDDLVNFGGDSRFAASFAVGGLAAADSLPACALPTPTGTVPTAAASPSPTLSPTPESGATATATPTATPTAGAGGLFLFGVTKSGNVVAVNLAIPAPTPLALRTPVQTSVLSSPALSTDGLLIFGTMDGWLHAVSTATGEEPCGWPVQLTAQGEGIRSSPSIGADGTVYVGADDGRVYAVGLP